MPASKTTLESVLNNSQTLQQYAAENRPNVEQIKELAGENEKNVPKNFKDYSKKYATAIKKTEPAALNLLGKVEVIGSPNNASDEKGDARQNIFFIRNLPLLKNPDKKINIAHMAIPQALDFHKVEHKSGGGVKSIVTTVDEKSYYTRDEAQDEKAKKYFKHHFANLFSGLKPDEVIMFKPDPKMFPDLQDKDRKAYIKYLYEAILEAIKDHNNSKSDNKIDKERFIIADGQLPAEIEPYATTSFNDKDNKYKDFISIANNLPEGKRALIIDNCMHPEDGTIGQDCLQNAVQYSQYSFEGRLSHEVGLANMLLDEAFRKQRDQAIQPKNKSNLHVVPLAGATVGSKQAPAGYKPIDSKDKDAKAIEGIFNEVNKGIKESNKERKIEVENIKYYKNENQDLYIQTPEKDLLKAAVALIQKGKKVTLTEEAKKKLNVAYPRKKIVEALEKLQEPKEGKKSKEALTNKINEAIASSASPVR